MTLGGLGLLAGAVICAGLAADPDDRALYYIGPFFGLLATIYFVPSVLGGVGLLRGRVWGKALIILESLLLLLALPIGTVMGGFGLWALLRPGSQLPPPSPAPPRPDPTLLVLIAMVACGFVVLLGAGFRLNGQPAPSFLGYGFYPAIAGLIASVAYLVVKRPFSPGGPAPSARRPTAPAQKPYADRIVAREWRDDDAVADARPDAQVIPPLNDAR